MSASRGGSPLWTFTLLTIPSRAEYLARLLASIAAIFEREANYRFDDLSLQRGGLLARLGLEGRGVRRVDEDQRPEKPDHEHDGRDEDLDDGEAVLVGEPVVQ